MMKLNNFTESLLKPYTVVPTKTKPLREACESKKLNEEQLYEIECTFVFGSTEERDTAYNALTRSNQGMRVSKMEDDFSPSTDRDADEFYRTLFVTDYTNLRADNALEDITNTIENVAGVSPIDCCVSSSGYSVYESIRNPRNRRRSHRSLQEGTEDVFDTLDTLEEILGAEYLLDSIAQALSTDELEDILEYIARMEDVTEYLSGDYPRLSEAVINEGPGAGYSIKGSGVFTNISDINITEMNDGYYEFTCNASGYVENIDFYSYGYGDTVENQQIPMEAHTGIYYFDDPTRNPRLDIKDEVTNESFTFDFVYGGGWSHSTYDGSLSEAGRELEVGSYADVQFIDAVITEQSVIDFIDSAVSGNNIYEYYAACSRDKGGITEEEGFDNEEEAIEFAKENGLPLVIKAYERDDFDGNLDIDFYEHEVVWENDFEDEEDW